MIKVFVTEQGWAYLSTVAETHEKAGALYVEQFGDLPGKSFSIRWPPGGKALPQRKWKFNENQTAVNLFSIYVDFGFDEQEAN